MSAPVIEARRSAARVQSPWAIQAEGLGKNFGGRTVLDGVDLQVAPGTVFGLLGPNGAGKTTTVRLLTTLLVPDRGRATVAGFDVVRQSTQVRRHIGLSGQLSAVDEKLTGRENLILVGKLYRLGRAGAVRRADALLERFELVEAGRRPTGTYSGGMRRRLDLAASLIADPPVLFLDEPTTGLDLTSRLILWQSIRDQVAAGTTVLLTTQYLEEADLLADQLAVVDGGRVIASGTPEELKREVGSERLELAFDSVAEADKAAAALGTDLPRTADRFGVLVPVTDGLRTVGACAGQLADLGLRPRDFAVRKPSLDDVFLALTGRPTADAESAPLDTSAAKD